MKAKADSASRGLERTGLELEGLKLSHAELETKHAEAERTIVDLRRQMEKWRTLEGREGAEVETLRKTRIELEIQVRELETRAEEAEKDADDKDSIIQKFQRKLEKYKAALEEHSVSYCVTLHRDAIRTDSSNFSKRLRMLKKLFSSVKRS